MQSDTNRSKLAASIVIPTKNRAALLERFLPSLAVQSITEPYEIIIVDNGSSDSTPEVAGKAAERWPHIRRIVEDRPGSAYACHAGALAASAQILIFIDDDMRAENDLVARHVAAHKETPHVCILGNVLSAPGRHPFERMMAYIFDGPRKTLAQRSPTPSDYWSGHVSMARDLYFRLGGYNKSFAEIGYGKDFDFGGRLIAAGIELRFIPEIITYHHFTERFNDRLKKSYQTGVACSYIKKHHPELPIDDSLTARGKFGKRPVIMFCRLVASLMEPFAYGEGVPITPLTYIYALGLRTALQLGAADYEARIAQVNGAGVSPSGIANNGV